MIKKLAQDLWDRLWNSYHTTIAGVLVGAVGIVLVQFQEVAANLPQPWSNIALAVLSIALVFWKQKTTPAP